MNNTKILLFLGTILPFLFISCDKDDSESDDLGPFVVELKQNLATKEFTYFSFEQNKQIEITDAEASQNSTWDIAFRGLNGRTNGGESGSGNVAIMRTNSTNFDDVISVEPFINVDNLWVQDVQLKTMLIDGITIPPVFINTGLNPLLQNEGWYSMDIKTMPPNIAPLNYVFIIRTVNNKYVKIQFQTVKDKQNTLGNISFKWDYIKEEGENKAAVYPYRLGEIIVSGNQKLSELLKDKNPEKVKMLSVVDKIIDQEDINFIKNNMPALENLDLTNATLSIRDSEYGFKDNKNVKHLVLPKNLEAVGFGHLAYTNLETVTFSGNKLLRIGEGAFAFSNKIKHLELPESLEVIEKQGFSVMRGLESIEVPEQVIIIPELCFYYCTSLKSVTFKGKLKKLGNGMVSYCKQLTKIKFINSEPPLFDEEIWPFLEYEFLVNKDKTPRCFFYVPKGSVSTYQKAWKFTNEGDEAFFKEF